MLHSIQYIARWNIVHKEKAEWKKDIGKVKVLEPERVEPLKVIHCWRNTLADAKEYVMNVMEDELELEKKKKTALANYLKTEYSHNWYDWSEIEKSPKIDGTLFGDPISDYDFCHRSSKPSWDFEDMYLWVWLAWKPRK